MDVAKFGFKKPEVTQALCVLLKTALEMGNRSFMKTVIKLSQAPKYLCGFICIISPFF